MSDRHSKFSDVLGLLGSIRESVEYPWSDEIDLIMHDILTLQMRHQKYQADWSKYGFIGLDDDGTTLLSKSEQEFFKTKLRNK